MQVFIFMQTKKYILSEKQQKDDTFNGNLLDAIYDRVALLGRV